MRIQDIIRTIQDNFFLALTGVFILAIFLGIGYFFIYKKLLKGKKSLNKKKLFMWTLFIGYIFMVIGVTFIGRGARQYGDSNLHFLSTYREAWNSLSSVAWRQLILNVVMLLPLGILLPLLNKRFQKLSWTFLAAFLLTITIEIMQLLTGYGVFDIDDIFNNMLGAIIGYGIVIAIITLFNGRRNKYKKSIIYLSPLIAVVFFSIGVVGFYNSKEFGNLYINHRYKINMKNIDLNLNTNIKDKTEEVVLSSDKKYNVKKVPIYKAPSYDIESGLEFFKEFLKEKEIEEEIEEIHYDDMAIYRLNGKNSYHMWFYFKDGSYNYIDFSMHDEGINRMDVDEEIVLNELKKFDIAIPDSAVISKYDDGNEVDSFQWNVEKNIEGEHIINGQLSCIYYSDHTIKEINNNIVKYKKVKDISIKNKEEVYKDIEKGKFNFYKSENIKTIDIEDIRLDYLLDSKGYYQPVYLIDIKVNGEDNEIYVPAI